jgi:hypothetical protein
VVVTTEIYRVIQEYFKGTAEIHRVTTEATGDTLGDNSR